MEVSDIKVGMRLDGAQDGRMVRYWVTRVGQVRLTVKGREATEIVDLSVRGEDGLERAAEYAYAGGSACTLDLGGQFPILVSSFVPAPNLPGEDPEAPLADDQS